MKKSLKSVLVAFVLLVGVFALTACDNSKGIVGSWKHSGYVYTFNSDKTGTYDAMGTKMKFTYKDDGKKVSILYDGNTVASDYEYKIDGKKLTIKDSFGSDVEYTKK